MILGETVIVQPDLVYLDRARLEAISRRGIEEAPTLIDRSTKRQLYARHRVPFYWLVDPEDRAVEALVLAAGYTLAVGASGTEPVDIPPFTDLALIPAALWP